MACNLFIVSHQLREFSAGQKEAKKYTAAAAASEEVEQKHHYIFPFGVYKYTTRALSFLPVKRYVFIAPTKSAAKKTCPKRFLIIKIRRHIDERMLKMSCEKQSNDDDEYSRLLISFF